MATPVTIVATGGIPVVNVPGHAPATPTANAVPIVLVERFGAPMTLVNEDGTAYEPEE